MSVWYLLLALPVYVMIHVWWMQRRARKLCADAGLPKWPELPLLGNIMQFYGDSRFIFRRLVEISSLCDESNLVPFQVWFGPKLIIIFSKPEDIKLVTNTFVEKPYYYNFGKHFIGDGLVTAPAPVWKRNIKKLGSTFSSSIVDGFQGVFNDQASKLVKQLRSEVGQPPFDVMHKYLAFATLEAICQSSLGLDNLSGEVVTRDYYDAYNKTLELLVVRGLNVLLHPECLYRLTPGYKELKKNIQILHNVSWTVVRKRRQEWNERKKNQKIDIKNEEQPTKKFSSFLDILMDMSDTDSELTDEQIRAEVDTVIVGGQETSASTLMYTMLMLGCHPRVQQKIYEEMQMIFGDSDRSATKDDLVRMKYCEAAILESLRLFPPIPVVMRQSDCELKSESLTIPANTVLCINAWGTGRSRTLWGDDAACYRPERWLEDKQMHSAAFLPFSYGRRSCIGKKYALALLKTVISQCIRELVFVSEADKLDFKVDIALKPVKGHLLTVRPR